MDTLNQDLEIIATEKVTALDTYFETRGVNVVWNTLGRTPELRTAYVHDTQLIVDASTLKQSQYVKQACYDLFTLMTRREKFTGFEKFAEQDIKLRIELTPLITESQFSPTQFVNKVDPTNLPDESYYEALKQSLVDLNKGQPILLYLSGGIDSELVAKALLDAQVPFTPVVFRWLDAQGQVKNDFDTSYAFDFCDEENLACLIKDIDIETLWATKEFQDLSVGVQLLSSHLTTYAHMVNVMSSCPEYAGATHLFGGEVRYVSNFNQDDGTQANLVTLTKIMPAYNGLTYASGPMGIYSGLVFYTDGPSPGHAWLIRSNNSGYTGVWPTDPSTGTPNPTAGPGNWSNTVGQAYEMYTTTVITTQTYSGGGYVMHPQEGPSWHPISFSANFILDIAGGAGTVLPTTGVSLDVTQTIYVRAVGHTMVQTSTIRFKIYDFTAGGGGGRQPPLQGGEGGRAQHFSLISPPP